jgi:acyl carrier protein
MNSESLIALFAEALEVDPAVLTTDLRIEDVDEWGSIGWLTIMSMLDDRYGRQIPAKQIRSFVTVGDVIGYLTAESVPANKTA